MNATKGTTKRITAAERKHIATERTIAQMEWSRLQQIKDVARGIIPALSEEQQQEANEWLAKQQEQDKTKN
jgi:hypothetical protein